MALRLFLESPPFQCLSRWPDRLTRRILSPLLAATCDNAADLSRYLLFMFCPNKVALAGKHAAPLFDNYVEAE